MTAVQHADDVALDQLGPVDYVVVEFPAGKSNFTGEMAEELLALVDAGTIRVIDVLILVKDEDGSIEALELSDIEQLGELQALEAELAELLAADDVAHLAAAMDPGSTAGVLIYENLWAAPFASAARRSGGQLTCSRSCARTSCVGCSRCRSRRSSAPARATSSRGRRRTWTRSRGRSASRCPRR